jgi:hypothetical protein
MSDPWPGYAIRRAINSLPQSGGTVIVDDGIWLFDSGEKVSRGNFTMQGSSLNAQLYFTTGWLAIGAEGTDIFDVTISTLTVDQSSADINASGALQLWQCNSCELSDSVLYGHSNGSVAVFITLGGSDGRILRNKFLSRSAGGSQLQINPLGGSSNSGFLVANNELDSVNILIIGASDINVTRNYMHNQTLGNFIAMMFTPITGIVTSNLLFDYNVIDATVGDWNMAILTGIPQDPGLSGVINNITIDHNTLRGTGTIIAANNYDRECLATCPDISQTSNIQITNNSLESLWGPSLIDVSGGSSGSVNGARIDGNILSNDVGRPNMIGQDNHSYNVSISNNSP